MLEPCEFQFQTDFRRVFSILQLRLINSLKSQFKSKLQVANTIISIITLSDIILLQNPDVVGSNPTGSKS